MRVQFRLLLPPQPPSPKPSVFLCKVSCKLYSICLILRAFERFTPHHSPSISIPMTRFQMVCELEGLCSLILRRKPDVFILVQHISGVVLNVIFYGNNTNLSNMLLNQFVKLRSWTFFDGLTVQNSFWDTVCLLHELFSPKVPFQSFPSGQRVRSACFLKLCTMWPHSAEGP